jgi:hypothetical protein
MSKLRNCRACGFGPLETNADQCPDCGKVNPAPGYFTRLNGRIVAIGLILVAIVIVVAALSSS